MTGVVRFNPQSKSIIGKTVIMNIIFKKWALKKVHRRRKFDQERQGRQLWRPEGKPIRRQKIQNLRSIRWLIVHSSFEITFTKDAN